MQCRVLGPIEVDSDIGSRQLRGQQAMLVSHLVAAYPEPVPFATLEQAFWAEHPPSHPEAAIKVAVARLRKTVGQDIVQHSSAGYRLTSESHLIDQAVFTTLAVAARAASERGEFEVAIQHVDQALACWRGAAFATVADHITLAAAIRHLDEERAGLEDLLVELLLATGKFDQAAANATRNSDAIPLRERRWEQLMIALCLAGRVAEALRMFQQYRSLLGAEVGLEPGSSIVDLERAVTSGAPIEPWLRLGVSTSGHDDLELPDLEVPRYLKTGPHIPGPVDSFVGRSSDLASLDAALESGRMITVVGAPGVGKTRLVVTWAQSMSPRLVRWIALGPEAPGDAVAAIANQLGVADLAALRGIRISARRDKHFFLVLDNCEHVADELSPVLDELLGAHPNLTVIATSRVALNHNAERTLRVGPLDEQDASLLLRSRSDLGAELSDADVATLVQSTDGIPLAVELAATRLRTRSVDEVAAVGFSLDNADGEARFAAGIDDMADGDQRLFEALSTMKGSFSVEAAAHVSQRSETETRTALNRLAEASLVDLDAGPLSTRFRLLEPIRQLAQNRVDHAGEGSRLRDRHLDFYATSTVDRGVGLRGATEELAVDALRSEGSQVRAAWAHACAIGDVDRASMLAFSWWWMTLRSLAHRDYSRPYEATQLPGFEGSRWSIEVFASAAMSEWTRGRFRQSVAAGEAALQHAGSGGSAIPLDARFGLTASYSLIGRSDEAHDQMIAVIREAREQEAWYYLSGAQAQIAFAFALVGHGDDACRQAAAALESAELSENTSTLAFAHHSSALCHYEDDPRRALSSAYESIRLSTRVDNRWISGWTTALIASLYRRAGRLEESAVKLQGVMEHWHSVAMEPQLIHSICEAALLLDQAGDRDGVTLALTIANEGRLHHPMMPTDRRALTELREAHPTPAPTGDETELLRELGIRLLAIAGN